MTPPRIDLAPSSFLFLQVCWRGLTPYGTPPEFRQLDILPSNKYPLGQKGLTFAEAWLQMAESHTVGMLLLDADVLIDPIDMSAMYFAMRSDPSIIHVAPVRIWPKSTGNARWVWAHKKFGTSYEEWQTDRDDVDTASFCFTYIPRELIEACLDAGIRRWIYPNVDDNTFRVAREIGLKFHVVRQGCFPKHMNY